MTLSDLELLRYSRHILLEDFGIEAQQKLARSHALVIGAGGLGSVVLPYLAAAGVGKITVSDFDRVDLTNLQRQVIYTTDQIGSYKVEAVAERLRAINPAVELIPLAVKLEANAFAEIAATASVILDCTDNFPTRYLINQVSVQHRVPLVMGAAISWQGQCAVFDRRISGMACYRCLFSVATESEEARCSMMGVFSPIVAIVGGMQALEALKLLADISPQSSQKASLTLLDGLTSQYRVLEVPKDPTCVCCSVI